MMPVSLTGGSFEDFRTGPAAVRSMMNSGLGL
jgi:hypothetical protein